VERLPGGRVGLPAVGDAVARVSVGPVRLPAQEHEGRRRQRAGCGRVDDVGPPPPPRALPLRGVIAWTADHGQALVGIGLTRLRNSARARSVASS
jgi:hypothetical protein